MAITVRRLTQQPALGLSLVAGSDGADRIIDWAHPIELADPSPWLSGGELVMTTGLAVGASERDHFDYVERLVQAGSVALAFDTGMTFPTVPHGVCSAGDAFGFPILSVPATTPFIAITRVVIDELTSDQLRSTQRVVDQQENLARATLRGGIPAVVAALGRTLSCPVLVVDTEQRILASHGRGSENALAAVRAVAGQSRRRPASKVIADDRGTVTVQSVSAAQVLHGYLAVVSPGALNPPDRLLVAHAVSLISIELSKPAKVIDANQRLRTSTTTALLHMGETLDPSVLRYFGFQIDDPVAAIALLDTGPLIAAEKLVATHLSSLAASYLMTPLDQGLIVIVPASGAADLGSTLRRHLAAQTAGRVAGGLGAAVPLVEAACSARQATLAARSQPHGGFVEFDQLGTFSLLLGNQSQDELAALAGGALRALDDYDRHHHGEQGLVATLAAFLENNGERETTASVLKVHRHTLRNRLTKIGELLDRDLASAHVRAELWVAVKARELADMR